ncbi:MAG: hypothetical protein ABIQ88_16230 [Chitinophagaceae bacterium]
MKKIYGLLTALIISAAAMAQATPHEKEVVKKDVEKERVHRHAVAKNILKGKPKQVKAEHKAAVAYHKKTKRDIKTVHDNDVRRAKARQ